MNPYMCIHIYWQLLSAQDGLKRPSSCGVPRVFGRDVAPQFAMPRPCCEYRPRVLAAVPLMTWHLSVAFAYAYLGYVVAMTIEAMMYTQSSYWLCEVFIIFMVGDRALQRIDKIHWLLHGMLHQIEAYDEGSSSAWYRAVGAMLEEEKIQRSILRTAVDDMWRVEYHCYIWRGKMFGGEASLWEFWPGTIAIKYVAPEVWRGELMKNTSRFEMRTWRLRDLTQFMTQAAEVAQRRRQADDLNEPLLPWRRVPSTVPEADFQSIL